MKKLRFFICFNDDKIRIGWEIIPKGEKERKMKKKTLSIVMALLMVVSMLTACATKETTITSKWVVTEYEVNGKVTNVENDNWLLRLTAKDVEPQFVCKDGVNCTFSLNGKDHQGTLTEQDGGYRIDFNDTYKSFNASISGDRLELVNEAGTVRIEFKQK